MPRSIAPNTGSGAVVGWNVLLPAPNVRRQQLVRQTGSDVEFYSRDIVGTEPAKPWTFTADEADPGRHRFAARRRLVGGRFSQWHHPPAGRPRQRDTGLRQLRPPPPAVGSAFTPGVSIPIGARRSCSAVSAVSPFVPHRGRALRGQADRPRGPGSANFRMVAERRIGRFSGVGDHGIGRQAGLESTRKETSPTKGTMYSDPAMDIPPRLCPPR